MPVTWKMDTAQLLMGAGRLILKPSLSMLKHGSHLSAVPKWLAVTDDIRIASGADSPAAVVQSQSGTEGLA